MANLLIIQKENHTTIARVIENCKTLAEAKRKGINTKNILYFKFESLKECINEAELYSADIRRIRL